MSAVLAGSRVTLLPVTAARVADRQGGWRAAAAWPGDTRSSKAASVALRRMADPESVAA